MARTKKEKEEVDKLLFEKQEHAKGHFLIAGVDEVGRGPLAGPVCVAAVMMPIDDIIEGVDDSTANILFSVITESGEEFLIPATDDFVEEIDDEKREITMNLPDGLLDM